MQASRWSRLIVAALVSVGSVALSNPGAVQAELSMAPAAGARSTAGRIALGDAFTCFVAEGIVYCWGDNQEGAIGLPLSQSSSAMPVKVGTITTATAIAAGSTFACALLYDKTVSCWGRANLGQTGRSSTLSSPTPQVIAGLTGVTAIAAAGDTACALLDNTTVKCWGDNGFNGSYYMGGLGRGNDDVRSDYVPQPVTGLTGATAIAMTGTQWGGSRSCAVKSDTTVVCWGNNAYGTIGNGVSSNDWEIFLDHHNTPVTVIDDATGLALQAVTAIDLGMDQTCVVLANTTAKCWGENMMGQIGNTTGQRSLKATAVMSEDGYSALTGIAAISAGQYVTCVTMATGRGKCFGDNMNGMMGNGLSSSSGTLGVPIDVVSVTNFSIVVAGWMHTCGLTTDGGAFCWGTTANGRLGKTYPLNTFSDPTPVAVTGVVPQTITFAALKDRSIADVSFTLSATSSSGGAVSFASTTLSVCTVSGTTVTLVTIGKCTISASRASYAMWTAAESVEQSFNIASVLPTASTSAATGISSGKAVLNGVVDPKGASTTVKFVYGTSATLEGTTKEAAASTQTGSGSKDVSVSISDLADYTMYYFKVVATNSAGSVEGSILSFRSARPIGVTINEGAEFTNSRSVTVSVTGSAGSTQAILSNDGGFLAPQTFNLTDASADIPWTLVATKDERLPKVVYVKFVTRFGNQSLAQSDDIILDTTAPVTSSATAAATTVPSDAVATQSLVHAAKKPNGVRLRVKASDANSGIGVLELKTSSRGAVVQLSVTGPKSKTHTVYVKTTKKSFWIRSIDRAGNASKWVVAKAG